ncbi:MAG: antibiotic biosynthesis monooxygenase [Actinobacteria bacterium]|nr:antibiotic biosynthesis monooxygenase [Actinomycetota bacterium]
MIGVIVTFRYADEFDRARIENIAKEARATFEGMPALRSKFFTVDEDARRAVNFYVWESEDAARAFFSDALRQRVTGLYGSEPDIEFLDVVEAVENHRS